VKTPRTIMLTAASAALAITALGAPVTAVEGEGTIGLINGIPGQRIDFCINGKEVRSATQYGGRAYRTLTEGPKRIKIFKADKRKCRGTKIAEKSYLLTANADVVLVVGNKPSKKFTMFDNTDLGTFPPDGPPLGYSWMVTRHAATLGPVNIFAAREYSEWPTPGTLPVWRRGDEGYRYASREEEGTYQGVRATRPQKARRIAKSQMVATKNSYRYEWYLLGTNDKNAKFIVWTRPISS
jgi:hypothetical protein